MVSLNRIALRCLSHALLQDLSANFINTLTPLRELFARCSHTTHLNLGNNDLKVLYLSLPCPLILYLYAPYPSNSIPRTHFLHICITSFLYSVDAFVGCYGHQNSFTSYFLLFLLHLPPPPPPPPCTLKSLDDLSALRILPELTTLVIAGNPCAADRAAVEQ